MTPDDEIAALKQLLFELQNPTPKHIHGCPKGHEWACGNPYCQPEATARGNLIWCALHAEMAKDAPEIKAPTTVQGPPSHA